MSFIHVLLLTAMLNICLLVPKIGSDQAMDLWRAEQYSVSVHTPDADTKEETIMANTSMVYRIMDIFGCSEQTAQSLGATLERAVSDHITYVEEIPGGYNRILKLSASGGGTFYAKVGAGFFVSKVYKDSLDGEPIYRAMR